MPRTRADRPNYRLRRIKGVWRIVWYDADTKQTRSRSTGSGDRAAADQALAAFLVEIDQPDLGPEPTVSDVLGAYLEAKRGAVRDHVRLVTAANALRPKLGHVRVSEMTARHSRLYATERRKDAATRWDRALGRTVQSRQGIGDGTIGRELSTLNAALRFAKGEGLIREAPKVNLPKAPPPKDRWLTREESARLIEAADAPHITLFLHLALNTAARSGAIKELTWDRVDIERRLIDFHEPRRPRTSKGRAVVPINDVLLPELVAAKEIAMTEWALEYRKGRVHSIKRGFAAACRRAGLTGVTPHTLRHTAATWMAQAGVEIRLIAKYLGHSDSRITEQVYAKHHPDWLRGAAEALAGGVR